MGRVSAPQRGFHVVANDCSVEIDVVSRPAAFGASTNHAAECDPRAHGGTRGSSRPRAPVAGSSCWRSITNADDNRVPAVVRLSLGALARQYANTTAEIRAFEKHIHAWHRSYEEKSAARGNPWHGRDRPTEKFDLSAEPVGIGMSGNAKKENASTPGGRGKGGSTTRCAESRPRKRSYPNDCEGMTTAPATPPTHA